MGSPFAVSQSQTVISPTAGRKVDRIFQPISGVGPEIPNAMIGHAVVRLLNVTIAKPLPPNEVLQSRVTLLGLGCCARALDPGEQKNVAANAVTTNIVGRFIEFSFGFCWASPML